LLPPRLKSVERFNSLKKHTGNSFPRNRFLISIIFWGIGGTVFLSIRCQRIETGSTPVYPAIR
jgi:hypothetical protein